MPVPTPPIIVEAFASKGVFNLIPVPDQTGVVANAASFDTGFPVITSLDINAGGKPPVYGDMNGVLNMITAHLAALNAGQGYSYSAEVAVAIGGYAVGSVLLSVDGTGWWLNTVAGNITNPDTGGAGWVTVQSYGAAAVALAGANVTLTPSQYNKSYVVLQGTLTANVQVIFPNTNQTWLIINNTTGSFVVTAKTATGTGVVIPATGASAPTGVYGDRTNLYPTVAPLGFAISIPPTANSIVERDPNGYVYGVFFNMTGPAQVAAAVNVVVDSGDGFFRKVPRAAFEAQLVLSELGGAVSSGQVPLGAVLQYAAQLWNSPALTGVPSAPTPPSNSSSGAIATTAFANPGQSINPNGYVKLPGGIILQWGQILFSGTGNNFQFGTLTFPIAFPNACFAAVGNGTTRTNGGVLTVSGNIDIVAMFIQNAASALWRVDSNAGNSIINNHAINWFAVGW